MNPPAPIRPDSSGFAGLVINIFRVVNLTLVFYFLWRLNLPDTLPADVQNEFILIRNGLYVSYTVCLAVAGLLLLSRVPKSGKFSSSPGDPGEVLIPGLIINIIFTTFTYALSLFIFDLFHRF